MTNDRVRVIGAERLAATLAVAGHRFADMPRATAAAGRLVETRARGLAPKRTGRLASSLHSTSDGGTVAIASGLVYAPVIHFGWAAHGISPHPFLVPVAAATEPVWRGYYAAELNLILKQVKGA